MKQRYSVEREGDYWIVVDRENVDNVKICDTRREARKYKREVETMAKIMKKERNRESA